MLCSWFFCLPCEDRLVKCSLPAYLQLHASSSRIQLLDFLVSQAFQMHLPCASVFQGQISISSPLGHFLPRYPHSSFLWFLRVLIYRSSFQLTTYSGASTTDILISTSFHQESVSQHPFISILFHHHLPFLCSIPLLITV